MIASPRVPLTLEGDLLAALDPVVLARRAGLDPDPWQADVLRSTASQQLLLCSRQAGKSTVSATLAVHRATTGEGRTILLMSPSLRQSQELFRKAMDLYIATGQTVEATVENRLTLELANGSRIVSLPGREQTIRGFSSVDLLVIDEASLVEDSLYNAIRPMLAVSRGRIVALTTPRGRRGWFYREWTDGGTDWRRTQIPATEVPRIDPTWLEAERRRIPRSIFEQEYLCRFNESDDAVFAADDIEAMVSPGVAPLFAGGHMLSASFMEDNDEHD